MFLRIYIPVVVITSMCVFLPKVMFSNQDELSKTCLENGGYVKEYRGYTTCAISKKVR